MKTTAWDVEQRLNKKIAALHAELLEIHKIEMCIAECPPVLDTDTLTVKMVKEMAQRINATAAAQPDMQSTNLTRTT